MTPIQDCAVDYYKAYFDSDNEVHFVVNFALNTTCVIGKYNNHLDVTVHEYADGEEHDAKELGGGDILGQYWVDIETGEITTL